MIIALAGPHAIGKTTAVKRWVAKYSGLTGVLADNELEITQTGQVMVKEWKDTVEDKCRQVERLQQRQGVSVVESARTTILNWMKPEEPVILLVTTGDIARQHMINRCLAKGKKFNDPYWTAQKLNYESRLRYLNYAQKNLQPSQYKVFEITDQARDWPEVDEYFSSLYRRYHNAIMRSR